MFMCINYMQDLWLLNFVSIFFHFMGNFRCYKISYIVYHMCLCTLCTYYWNDNYYSKHYYIDIMCISYRISWLIVKNFGKLQQFLEFFANFHNFYSDAYDFIIACCSSMLGRFLGLPLLAPQRMHIWHYMASCLWHNFLLYQ